MTTTVYTHNSLGVTTPFPGYPAGTTFRRVRVFVYYYDPASALTLSLITSTGHVIVDIHWTMGADGGPGVIFECTFELPIDWGTTHQYNWATVSGVDAKLRRDGAYSSLSTVEVYMSDAPFLDSFFQDYWDGDGVTPPAPTLDDYIARGITGVTIVNLADVNDAIWTASLRTSPAVTYGLDHTITHAGVYEYGVYNLRLPEDIQALVTYAGLVHNYTANLTPRAPMIWAGVASPGAGVLGMRFESVPFVDDFGHYVNSDMAGEQFTVDKGQTAMFGERSFDTHGYVAAAGVLEVAPSTDFDFGSGDFSIDMWVSIGTKSEAGSVLDGAVLTTYSSVGYHPAYEITIADSHLCFKASGTGSVIDVDLVSPYTLAGWTHIEVARTGSIFNMYVGGESVASAVFYGPLAESAGKLLIGTTPYRRAFTGYIDEIRMIKGGAVNTGPFLPPTMSFASPGAAYLTAPSPKVASSVGDSELWNIYLTAPSPTLTAAAWITIIGDVSLVAPPPTISAGLSFATSELSAPSPTLMLGAKVGAECTAPRPTIRACSGAKMAIAAPRAKLSAQAHDSVDEQAIALIAPSPTLDVSTGAYAKSLKPQAPSLSSSGTGTLWASVALTAPRPATAAECKVSAMASASLTFGYVDGHNYPLSSFSGALADLTIPLAEVTSSGLVGSVARAYLSAPTTNPVARTGATVLVEAPPPWLDAWAIRGGTARLALSTPRPRLEVRAGTSVALLAPAPKLTSRALRGGTVLVSLSAPEPSLASASGTQTALAAPSSRLSAHGYTCAASSALNAPKPNLVGYGGAVCRVTMTGKPTVQVMGATGGVSSGAVTCPLFELTAAATTQSHGGANLLAPAARVGAQVQAWLAPPGARLTAIGTAVVTATYEAYAVNLLHAPRGNEQPVDEVTRYTNFPFTHIVRYQSSYYGANSTGLYLLEGTTDAGAPVAYDVKTAVTDFKSPMRKNVASAYFGGRLGPDTTVTLHAGEGKQTQPYTYTTPRGQLAQNYRQVLGKGVRQHRYYAIGVAGSGALDLDTVELDTHNMTRRI